VSIAERPRYNTDMIFATRKLEEKCQQQYSDINLTFVDLTKAFDIVCREWPWKTISKLECTDKFISIMRQLHNGMFAGVLHDWNLSEPSEVANGAKQGYAPMLFLMLFSPMLCCAFRDNEDGIGYPHQVSRRW